MLLRPQLTVALIAGVACPALAQPRAEPHAVVGRVSGPQRAPVRDAEVWLVAGDSIHHATRTDSAGDFAFRGVAPRSFTMRVRRLGYRPRSLSAIAGPVAGRPHDIVLEEMPTELDQVKVVARVAETNGRLREFYAHRERAKFGYFFDRDAIRTNRPRYLSELMRGVPGARLLPGRLGSIVRIRGCRPLLWVDGVRVPNSELDEFVNMNDVEAVEVYNSFAGIPPQYVDRNTNCGAVVVWLKS